MLFGWPRRVLSHCVQLMYDEVATILAVNLLNYKYRRARVQAIKSSSTWLYLAPPWTIIFVRLRGDEEETSGSCALELDTSLASTQKSSKTDLPKPRILGLCGSTLAFQLQQNIECGLLTGGPGARIYKTLRAQLASRAHSNSLLNTSSSCHAPNREDAPPGAAILNSKLKLMRLGSASGSLDIYSVSVAWYVHPCRYTTVANSSTTARPKCLQLHRKCTGRVAGEAQTPSRGRYFGCD
eukprot:1177557-Prorocentrum_minimum.AAC.2